MSDGELPERTAYDLDVPGPAKEITLLRHACQGQLESITRLRREREQLAKEKARLAGALERIKERCSPFLTGEQWAPEDKELQRIGRIATEAIDATEPPPDSENRDSEGP